ncbi:MAG: tRNA uridine-5-carboxymethylaminomethyl(34) synthesis GTPase MnmE [Streptococcaceae bacterium]|nr:tRNA uridine-5-carboxymethylaminomethyl(34) synthesis GTPase MnmE [Streptococcaceae bacterium]
MTLTHEMDTIAAISTPIGEGAISIVRLSGTDAIDVAAKVFKGRDLREVRSHTITYGHIVAHEELLDEVMVSVFRAPKTFTRENMVEINTHGGIAVTQEVLQLFLRCGARLAEPGEFTKRAFLNGRIDLTQAESVMDVIRAKTDAAANVAVKQLDGSLSRFIGKIRQEILETLAEVEVNIDYPEYDDVEIVTSQLLREKTAQFQALLENLLATAKRGKILREGLKTAIIGRPNVGKSSLLNALLHEEKAIVTDVAGTTRDTISEFVNLGGVPLELMDTAGIRETDDVVEAIGVARSKKVIDEADLVLLVLDASSNLTDEDKALLELSSNLTRIILLNKTDLAQQVKLDGALEISALQSLGLEALSDKISELFFDEKLAVKSDSAILSNARQIALVEEALSNLTAVNAGLEAGLPVDLVQVDLTACWRALGEIVGDNAPDALITQLFSQFCLGK